MDLTLTGPEYFLPEFMPDCDRAARARFKGAVNASFGVDDCASHLRDRAYLALKQLQDSPVFDTSTFRHYVRKAIARKREELFARALADQHKQNEIKIEVEAQREFLPTVETPEEILQLKELALRFSRSLPDHMNEWVQVFHEVGGSPAAAAKRYGRTRMVWTQRRQELKKRFAALVEL